MNDACVTVSNSLWKKTQNFKYFTYIIIHNCYNSGCTYGLLWRWSAWSCHVKHGWWCLLYCTKICQVTYSNFFDTVTIINIYWLSAAYLVDRSSGKVWEKMWFCFWEVRFLPKSEKKCNFGPKVRNSWFWPNSS